MKTKHSIDLPFSLSLFMVFVLCAFMVLLLQVNGYQHIVSAGESMQQLHTPLAYIKTSVRSSDVQGSITTFTQDGVSGIKIYNQEMKTIRYIYEKDQQLKELQSIESLIPDFTTGNDMFPIRAFQAELQGSILHVSISDMDNQTQEVSIRVHTN